MSISHKIARSGGVLYRWSLRLLPRRFYAEYAEQMALDFDDLLRHAVHRGSICLVTRTTVCAVADVFLSAVRERFAMLHGELDITPRVNEVIAIASSDEYRGRPFSTDGRLLLGLATEEHGLAGIVLRELGVHADRLRASLAEPENSTEQGAGVDEPGDTQSPACFARQLTNAAECARAFGHDFIGTEHLALSLLADTNGVAARLIKRIGVDPSSLRDMLENRTRNLTRGRRA